MAVVHFRPVVELRVFSTCQISLMNFSNCGKKIDCDWKPNIQKELNLVVVFVVSIFLAPSTQLSTLTPTIASLCLTPPTTDRLHKQQSSVIMRNGFSLSCHIRVYCCLYHCCERRNKDKQQIIAYCYHQWKMCRTFVCACSGRLLCCHCHKQQCKEQIDSICTGNHANCGALQSLSYVSFKPLLKRNKHQKRAGFRWVYLFFAHACTKHKWNYNDLKIFNYLLSFNIWLWKMN